MSSNISEKSNHVLFITWDGPQSSYLESLFLPIFILLAQRGIKFHVLQFSWADDHERSNLQRMLATCDVTYESVRVIRNPLSSGSLLTTVLGVSHIRRAIRKYDIDVVMPRSTLPAMSAIRALKSFPRVRLVFDADGLPHDERVDFGGMSPISFAYRLLRDFESFAVRRANAVLTRSKKAIDILVARGGAGVDRCKFHVVSNGRDEDLFRPISQDARISIRREFGINDDAPMLVYVGSSIQGKYCGREIFDFFRSVRAKCKNTCLLILTSSLAEVDQLLNEYEELRPFCHVKNLTPDNVPRYLGACDLGLVLIHSKFSMQAVAAIKLGEYLLCGVPVLASGGIGDSDELITDGIGYLLSEMSPEALDAAADWFLMTVLIDREGFRQRSRDSGLDHFALKASVDVYYNVINSIVDK